MLSTRTEKYLLFLLTFLVGIGMVYLAVISPGAEGGMDSYNHYMISKFSWKYPSELMLDQWGKPLYNILASPFAQFGFIGVEVFNVLLLLGTSWLVYFTAKAFHFKYAFLAAVIALFSPIFLDNTISGLTEPLSAFLLTFVVYLFSKSKVTAAAILAGFLPYARSEGYVIIAVIGIYLFFVLKNYRAFFYLLLGSVVINFIGWAVEGDPLWIYNSNPYIKVEIKQKSTCGSGDSLLHYVRAAGYTFTKLASILFLIGSVVLSIRWLKNIRDNRLNQLFLLSLGVFALYFGVHSLIWYYGKMGSCGYVRVMVVISPLLALIAAYGWEYVTNQLKKYLPFFGPRLDMLMVFLLTFYFIQKPIKIYGSKYPVEISQEMELYVEVADWYKEQDYADRHKYYLYPYLHILINGDPRDHDHFTDLWSLDMNYAPLGSIIIWDSHFGPNECNWPLKDLQNHPDLVEIKSFYPETPFVTILERNYEIHVFERTKLSD
jgi:hypothetical protein